MNQSVGKLICHSKTQLDHFQSIDHLVNQSRKLFCKQAVRQSLGQAWKQPVCHENYLFGQSVTHLVSQSKNVVSPAVSQSVSRSVIEVHVINQSLINQSTNQPTYQPISQPASQSFKQSINQSINKSLNQSISHSTTVLQSANPSMRQ